MNTTSPTGGFPKSRAEFLAALRGTQYEELFRDESKLDATFADLLKRSADPLAREIGSGLADGTLTKEQVGGSGVYAEFVSGGLGALRQLDYGEVFDSVAEEQEQAREEAATEEDEDRDVWQGLRRGQGRRRDT
jgi:hypothetical protein